MINTSRFGALAILISQLILQVNCFTIPRVAFPQTQLSTERNHRSSKVILNAESDSEKGSELATTSSNSFMDALKVRYNIAQKSRDEGASVKQVLADVLAGEYDSGAVKAEVEEAIKSAPCVMFTWQSSPSCKKAVEAFDLMGANVTIVRLDDPWDKGNPMRAELGKLVGRTSVPFVFVGGEYIGGFDGGISETAPGMVNLAFKGELAPKLKEVGAL